MVNFLDIRAGIGGFRTQKELEKGDMRRSYERGLRGMILNGVWTLAS